MDYRNEQDILVEMVEKAMDNGLLRTNEDLITNIKNCVQTENQYILDLSTHAYILSQLEEKNYENYQNIDITTASGEALDNLGRLVNVHRNPAQPLVVEVTVGTGVALSENITVPVGTKVLLQGIYDDVAYDFTTNEDLTIPAGSTEGKVYANSSILGYYGSLPIGAVVGLQGFPDLSATNTDATTGGKNIEEDDDYRERIRRWSTNIITGTRANIESYLDAYDGLDEYYLVPRYNGVGTLKIVCVTMPSLLEQISSDVYENCMLVTDYPPYCVLPTEQSLQTIQLYITKQDIQSSYTDDELKQMVSSSVHSFVYGGMRRDGSRIAPYTIGKDWYPSELISFLVTEYPEFANIRIGDDGVVVVPDDERVGLTSVEVEFE